MPRILIDGTWYEPLGASVLYETEYEDLLLNNAAVLYPTFWVVRYRLTVETDAGSARPHLVLVDKKYREWWFVSLEVEPPSRQRTEQMIRVVRTSRYDKEQAEILVARNKALTVESTLLLLRQSQPRVLVLVNGILPTWASEISSLDGVVGVAEVFQSSSAKRVLRINGKQPEPSAEVLAHCHRDPLIENLLVVDNPSSLGPWRDGFARISIDEVSVEWARTDEGGKTWLSPNTKCPLPVGIDTFVLTKTDDGRLSLLPAAPVKPRRPR